MRSTFYYIFIFITFAALGVECKEEKSELEIQDRTQCSIENYMCERDMIKGEERRETPWFKRLHCHCKHMSATGKVSSDCFELET